MNLLPMYSQCGYVTERDVSATVHASALSIPCSTNLSEAEQSLVIDKIREFLSEAS